jgi:transcription initiation factor TFIID subunit 2
MDLQTMARRLERGKYKTYRSLFGDFDKIVANCKQFNTPNTEPIWHVLVMEKAWRAEWKAASTLSYHTKRGLTSLIKAVKLHGASYPFRESVRPILPPPSVRPSSDMALRSTPSSTSSRRTLT